MKQILSTRRILAASGAAGIAVLLGACASKGAPPVAELTNARASIAQAESAGAQKSAPVDLLAARDKLGKAEMASRDERYSAARQLAEQAEADAEVAERKSRAAKAEAAAAELTRANEVLRKELERKSRS